MAKIFKNVHIGENAFLEDGVIIGVPSLGKKDGEVKTEIGKNAYIRANTVIYAGVRIGDDFQTGPNVLIREENTIGNGVVVWHGATLNPGNEIGDGSRIHAGCFLEMTKLGKNVFLGPNVVFTNDPHPVVPVDFRECWEGARVEDGAVAGGNVTILPGVTIGKGAVIGAGSVVVKDIAAGKVAVGSPAKVIKKASELECKRNKHVHFPYKGRKI